MTDNPAALLRRAANLLREHIGYLQLLDIRGPWAVHVGPNGYPQEINNVGVPILIANTYTGPKAPPAVANYIALMHPGVGMALAAWLDSLTGIEISEHGPMDEEFRHALAVARALLGEAAE